MPADANRFLTRTADAVNALAERNRANPHNTATAKRELSSDGPAINLHDTLRREAARLADHPLRTATADIPQPELEAERERRLTTWESETETLAAPAAVTAYWGNDTTDRYWFADIERLATVTWGNGQRALNDLRRAPATLLTHSAGIAAIAAERWPLAARILTGPRAEDIMRRADMPAAALLGPETVLGLRTSAAQVHGYLKPIFTGHVVANESAFTEAWEHFEYLRLLVQKDAGNYISTPHLLVSGMRGDYRPLASQWLERELASGEQHPLLRAGFLGGDLERATTTQKKVDSRISEWVDQIGWSTSKVINRFAPFHPDELS
ncbi:hypothetical protein ACIRBZ_20205 [Streptomyces sp. NPDC094038]|uniref:hypothetical protein n=1 Tax=Streptomyces sp. NPDC094038 TaxID=3366055 RepID=UPI00382A1742